MNPLPLKLFCQIYLKITIKKEMNGDNVRIINIGSSGLLFTLVTDFINKGGQYSLNNINYSSYFKDKGDYDRSAYCKFWAPKDDNLRKICKINDFTSPSQILLKHMRYMNQNIQLLLNKIIQF